jgi:DNA-binding response OmpR family regulator
VVDDDPAIGEMLTKFLAKHNCRVISFTQGQAALDYLKTNPTGVNLLLTDMVMPEMTGLELTRQAKALYPALPVIVMSGSGEGLDRDEIFSLGADFIHKPFDLVDLLIRINSKITQSSGVKDAGGVHSK